MTDQPDYPYERQCENCSAYVYPRRRSDGFQWRPVDDEGCSRSALNHQHKVDGSYNFSAERAYRADLARRSSAPTTEETDMDQATDQPTTNAETPEYQAFQKREAVAEMIADVILTETEDQLTPEQRRSITLAAAEMLLSNYFMRAVER